MAVCSCGISTMHSVIPSGQTVMCCCLDKAPKVPVEVTAKVLGPILTGATHAYYSAARCCFDICTAASVKMSDVKRDNLQIPLECVHLVFYVWFQ